MWGRGGTLGIMGLVGVGSAGVALWVIGPQTAPSRPAALTASTDVFDTRFPPAAGKGDLQTAIPRTTRGSSDDQFATFTPRPSYPVTSGDAREGLDTGSLGSPGASAGAKSRNQRLAVFNEAQIASIKKRLNLSRSQEQHWPAVEAMLRKLAWKKTSDQKGKRQLVPLDIGALDLAQLQSTTAPLLMSFNDEQKRELRMLAHVAGMQSIFAKF